MRATLFSLTAGVVMLLSPIAPARQPYDEIADARAEIARMLECARAEQKPLVLMFGANWCPWCRDLDRLLETDKTLAPLADSILLRLNISVGDYDRNLDLAAEYGLRDIDDTGIPMLVVLHPDGSLAGVKNSDEFVVDGHYQRDRIARFLHSYTPR